MKLKLVMLVSLFAFGFAMSAIIQGGQSLHFIPGNGPSASIISIQKLNIFTL